MRIVKFALVAAFAAFFVWLCANIYARAEVLSNYRSKNERDGVWVSGLRNSTRGLIGFTIKITNLTGDPIIANWTKTSIHCGEIASVLLMDGQKFVDKDAPPTPSVIPPFATIAKETYPSYQIGIGYKTGWWIDPIPMSV
ncbi:MAG: hypothetical protein LBP89_08320 [Helicobacteraceae bacterium]|jgi:hypothetical protein|nr:hypothetical protein [Helicobacteraceae bacterium]